MSVSRRNLALLSLALVFSTRLYSVDKGQVGSHSGGDSTPQTSTPPPGQTGYVRPLAPSGGSSGPAGSGQPVDATGESDDVARLVQLLEKEIKAPDFELGKNDADKKVGEQPGADSKAKEVAKEAKKDE